MSIDYRPLFVPVSREEVTRFRKESRVTAQPWAHSTAVTTAISVAVGAVGVIVVGGIMVTFLPVVFGSFGQGGTRAFSFFFPLFLLAVLGIGGWGVYRFIFGAKGRWESLLRRARFAAANGLVYIPTTKNPGYPGTIFSLGDSRKSYDNYRSTEAPQLDLGNYSYTTGSGKNCTTHTWGYLALRLERKLPHMLLDARGNNGLFGGSNLPTSFRRDQRLSLEGDFDKYFTLYCPKQYERDALYVFTPDLMALLIDESATFDVEIVDDWMFVYSDNPLSLDDATTVNRLFRIVETVGAKTLRQTDRYTDERIGNPAIDLVAPQGQRLKKGFTFASIGVIAVFGWIVFNFIRAWL